VPVKVPTKCPPSWAAVRSSVCYLAIAGMFRRADSCLIHGRLAVLVLLFCPIQFDRQVRGRFSRGSFEHLNVAVSVKRYRALFMDALRNLK
jgi:hypothetical protein